MVKDVINAWTDFCFAPSKFTIDPKICRTFDFMAGQKIEGDEDFKVALENIAALIAKKEEKRRYFYLCRKYRDHFSNHHDHEFHLTPQAKTFIYKHRNKFARSEFYALLPFFGDDCFYFGGREHKRAYVHLGEIPNSLNAQHVQYKSDYLPMLLQYRTTMFSFIRFLLQLSNDFVSTPISKTSLDYLPELENCPTPALFAVEYVSSTYKAIGKIAQVRGSVNKGYSLVDLAVIFFGYIKHSTLAGILQGEDIGKCKNNLVGFVEEMATKEIIAGKVFARLVFDFVRYLGMYIQYKNINTYINTRDIKVLFEDAHKDLFGFCADLYYLLVHGKLYDIETSKVFLDTSVKHMVRENDVNSFYHFDDINKDDLPLFGVRGAGL